MLNSDGRRFQAMSSPPGALMRLPSAAVLSVCPVNGDDGTSGQESPWQASCVHSCEETHWT